MSSRARILLGLLVAVGVATGSGCSYQVLWMGDPLAPLEPSAEPALLTMAVRPGSFARAKVQDTGVAERFAAELRRANLFRGVMYPIPAGVRPTWAIELNGSDELVDPNSNFWKAFFAQAVLPLAFFLTLEEDYTLELEALVIRDSTLVRSYVARAPVKQRFKVSAPEARMHAERLEMAVDHATRSLLEQIRRDLPELEAADRS